MNRKIIAILYLLLACSSINSQESKVTGNFYSIIQFDPNSDGKTIDNIASNNYLDLQITSKKWLFDLGFESYLSQQILGFAKSYDGSNISNYSIKYSSSKAQVTLGHAYKTFGSGLLFRTWRDRQIGIDNSILGLHADFKISKRLDVSSFIGKQRKAFGTTKGTIYGCESILNLSNSAIPHLKLNMSILGNYENLDHNDYQKHMLSYMLRISGRMKNGLSLSTEFVKKGNRFNQMNPSKFSGYSGNGFLMEVEYVKKKWGIVSSLRRLHNIGIFSDNELSNVKTNIFFEGQLNYIPSLTTIDQYSLKYLYAYQPQFAVNLFEKSTGDIGYDINGYIKSKKGTFLGGKYGSKWTFSFSNWQLLNGELVNSSYKSGIFDLGALVYQELNIAHRRKLNKKLQAEIFVNKKDYNQEILESKPSGAVKSYLIGTEWIYKVTRSSSLTYRLQYLHTEQDQGDWAGLDVEYFINNKFSLSCNSQYNFLKNEIFFASGFRYSTNRLAISLGYFKIRDGYLCAGGICRFVPGFKGLQLTTKINFGL